MPDEDPQPPGQAPATAPPNRRRRRPGCLLAFGILLGALIGAVLFGLQPLLRHLATEEARKHGIALQLGEVHLGWSEIRIEHFHFSLLGLSSIQGEVEVLTVSLDGLDPTYLEAHGVQLELEGSAATLAVGLSEWTKAHPRLLRVPTHAAEVNLVWRAGRDLPPWLDIAHATIEPHGSGSSFVAERTIVAGIDIGKVGASSAGSTSTIRLGFGEPALERAPVTIEVDYAAAEPEALITLRPTPLEQLAKPLGVALPIAGVTAHGTARLRFPAGPMEGPIEGSVQGTFDGYSPPVPREIRAFVYGQKTELTTEIRVSDDRRRINLTDTKVSHGGIKLQGEGSITRQPGYADIALELTGHLLCVDVAKAVAQARLGQQLGGILGSAAQLTMKGSVGIRLEISATTRDLSQAKITQHVGLGCGLRSWSELLPKIEVPDIKLELPKLDDLLP